MGTIRVMCLGDVVGRPGRIGLKQTKKTLREDHRIDFLIVNGENAAGGVGIDGESASEIRSFGADVITLGDHTWNKREVHDYLNRNASFCIRPANYPAGAPGVGSTIVVVEGVKIGVMNLLGRIFVGQGLECPFRAADELINGPLKDCTVRICDFHAEATSEKFAMARYLDGRVSLLFGTHTHVQTADEQILEGGTAYITDVGMCGSQSGVIGMDTEVALGRFLTALPSSYKVASGVPVLCGVIAEIDTESGKATAIERFRQVVE